MMRGSTEAGEEAALGGDIGDRDRLAKAGKKLTRLKGCAKIL